ncbi:hypothetical protein HU200_004210 [Digitaria exilis]|uniref:Uncharacterized protein n=1 Tax=Digitaria exilis TaxID=1010633 RepID=A0A835FTS6_9POAL|nr:hypothetical protein HU200_004210 [Digitaria exilis]
MGLEFSPRSSRPEQMRPVNQPGWWDPAVSEKNLNLVAAAVWAQAGTAGSAAAAAGEVGAARGGGGHVGAQPHVPVRPAQLRAQRRPRRRRWRRRSCLPWLLLLLALRARPNFRWCHLDGVLRQRW